MSAKSSVLYLSIFLCVMILLKTTMAEENGHGNHPSATEEAEKKLQKTHEIPNFRRRSCLSFCFCVLGFFVVVAVILLGLGLTIYKVRGLEMRLNTITIQQITATSTSTNVIVDVSVKNPNPVSYYFDKTTTSFYYRNSLIGVSGGPSGMARAHRTYRMNVTVGVLADGLMNKLLEGGVLTSDGVTIDSATMVGGHVKIIGLLKHHVNVEMNCTVKVAVVNLTILDQNCRQRVWI